MRTIWKYDIPLVEETHIVMPKGAKPLTAQMQDDRIYLWALVDTDTTSYLRHSFAVVGTGKKVFFDPSGYIGTVQLTGALDGMVFHVFDLGETA